MKVHGWCEKCRRIRRVTQTHPGASEPIGICAECEEAGR